MVKQRWTVIIEEIEHTVEYECHKFSGKTVLTVDGESFTTKTGLFGTRLERCEPILVGGARAMLNIGKSGRAELTCRDGEIKQA